MCDGSYSDGIGRPGFATRSVLDVLKMVSWAQTRRSTPGQWFLIGKKSDNYPLHFFGYQNAARSPLGGALRRAARTDS